MTWMLAALRRKLGNTALGALTLALLLGCGSRTPLPIVRADGAVEDDIGGSCSRSSQPIGEIPIDLYFMMDKSTSMSAFDQGQSLSRWQAVANAMKTFVQSPVSAGLGAGMAFFPRIDNWGGPLCGAADYAFPVVPLGVLPAIAPAMLTGIGAQMLAIGTPTTPALQGAHIYARGRAASGRVAAVVLVTDGQPRQCDSSITSTAAVATQASAGSPSVKTYVLGVGPSLASLDEIAAAGGTGQAYLVESGGEKDLNDALDGIRRSALSCAYVIPLASREAADRFEAKVTTRLGDGGSPVPVPRVADREACSDAPGWYYERGAVGNDARPDDVTPNRVTLCPAACDPLVKVSGSHLDVEVGCRAFSLL